MYKKFLCVFMTMVFLLASVSVCNAAEMRASELIVSRTILKYAMGGGQVKFTATMSCSSAMDKLGLNEIKVQEYYNGSWRTVKTVTDRYSYDSGIFAYTVTYSGVVGRQYRAYVEYYAKLGSVSDTKTRTSNSIVAE